MSEYYANKCYTFSNGLEAVEPPTITEHLVGRASFTLTFRTGNVSCDRDSHRSNVRTLSIFIIVAGLTFGAVFGRLPIIASETLPPESTTLNHVFLPLVVNSITLPDLNAAYIERFPRYEYNASKNQPSEGDTVTFEAHVANRGSQATGEFAYIWYIDNSPVVSALYPSLAPGEVIILTLNWIWQTGPHKVGITLDPAKLISEISEQNNSIENQTNALAVGFWVEQSVYNYFNQHQVELGLGSVSWEDWAQRQISTWNQKFAEAVSPPTPQGIVERVRLDKVVIIPDGSWPDCANGPSPEDKTVDLVWGFNSELVGVNSGHTCSAFNFYIINPSAQVFEPSLLHEISHARYLIDLYGLNVYVNAVRLAGNMDNTLSSVSTERNVENDNNFPLPSYLAIDGELIICQSKTGNSFTNCSRGAEGTLPRSHSSGALVNLATVRLQDGQGNLVQGSSALPVIGDWNDHLYFNRYPDDIMSGGSVFNQYSAYAWNRIAGRRPVCGNQNPPCNIGEYLNNIPQHNVLEIHSSSGQTLPGAQVEIYQGKPLPLWYGKVFLNSADVVYSTNAQGQVDIGHSPFGSGNIVHTYGHSNALILLKISSSGKSVYRFFEVTETNEEYWFGNQETATYVITTTLPPDSDPTTGFGQWAATTSLPQPSSASLETWRGVQSIFQNGYVYVFGGRNADNPQLNNVYFSGLNTDGSLKSWIETSSIPGQYIDHVEVKVGHYIYLITGADGATDVYYVPINFDGSLGAWVRTTSLYPSRQNFAAVANGNYIYSIGGNSGGPRDFVKFASVNPNGSLSSWADTTPLPEPIEGHTAVAYNGYLYVIEPNSTVYYAVINMDGTVSSWNTTTALPKTMSQYSSFEYNGYLFMVGGGYQSYYAKFLPNGLLGQWQSTTSLPELRYSLRSGAYQGFAYAIGGYFNTNYKNTVYYAQIITP